MAPNKKAGLVRLFYYCVTSGSPPSSIGSAGAAGAGGGVGIGAGVGSISIESRVTEE